MWVCEAAPSVNSPSVHLRSPCTHRGRVSAGKSGVEMVSEGCRLLSFFSAPMRRACDEVPLGLHSTSNGRDGWLSLRRITTVLLHTVAPKRKVWLLFGHG